MIDTVLDRAPQVAGDEMRFGNVVVDPPQEILANELTALVSRTEERDLVDVMFLERSLRVEDAFPAALAKDGGCTPATLAWLLSQAQIPDGLRLPAGVTPPEFGPAWPISSFGCGGRRTLRPAARSSAHFVSAYSRSLPSRLLASIASRRRRISASQRLTLSCSASSSRT